MKGCSKCRETKELSEFYSDKHGCAHSWCKECVKVTNRLRYATDEEYRNNCKLISMRYRRDNQLSVKMSDKQRSQTIRRRFNKAKSSAKKRGISWTIQFEEFVLLNAGSCTYCASSLPLCGSGLDRIDNAAGYESVNVIPCCAECNRIKGPNLTYQEMVEVAKLLVSLRSPKLEVA